MAPKLKRYSILATVELQIQLELLAENEDDAEDQARSTWQEYMPHGIVREDIEIEDVVLKNNLGRE